MMSSRGVFIICGSDRVWSPGATSVCRQRCPDERRNKWRTIPDSKASRGYWRPPQTRPSRRSCSLVDRYRRDATRLLRPAPGNVSAVDDRKYGGKLACRRLGSREYYERLLVGLAFVRGPYFLGVMKPSATKPTISAHSQKSGLIKPATIARVAAAGPPIA